MFEEVEVLAHSAVRITGTRRVYFDPFQLTEAPHDAEIVCITHDHYDHFSPDDLVKVVNDASVIVMPRSMADNPDLAPFAALDRVLVAPGETVEVAGVSLEAVAAYNIGKDFHPKANGWVGYILTMDDTRYFVSGDTDVTPENLEVTCDVALVPVGGTYTFTAPEAAAYVCFIAPKAAIPTHYGSVVGTPDDGAEFVFSVEALNPDIKAFERM